MVLLQWYIIPKPIRSGRRHYSPAAHTYYTPKTLRIHQPPSGTARADMTTCITRKSDHEIDRMTQRTRSSPADNNDVYQTTAPATVSLNPSTHSAISSSEDQSDVVHVRCLCETVGIKLLVSITRSTRRRVNDGTYCGYTLSRARLACMKCHKMYFADLLMSGPAVYSGKYFSSETCETTRRVRDSELYRSGRDG